MEEAGRGDGSNVVYNEDIEVRLGRYLDAYHPNDPAPLGHRDLAEGIAEYLENSYHELEDKEDFAIRVYLPPGSRDEGMERALTSAVHNFYEIKERESRSEVRSHYLKSAGMTLLGIGLIGASVALPHIVGPATMATGVAVEVLDIGGWVWGWEGISNIFLSGAEKRREAKMYERLADAEVEFVYQDARPEAPSPQAETQD